MTVIILLLFSIGFGAAGIAIVVLTNEWSLIVTVFLLVCLALLAASLFLWLNQQKYWHKRSAKQGIKAIVKTIAVLIILGVVNILAIRHNPRWDITETQLHTLSLQSQAIIARLERPLQVLVFDRTVDPNLEDLLQNYRRQSDEFQFRFINPEQEISLARQYGVRSLGEIYLEYGEKKQKLKQDSTTIARPIDESQISNAIEAIQRERIINVYLLQGHGEATLEPVERGLAQAVSSLTARGYNVRELNLATQKQIPDDADLIAIVGATRKLLTAEVTSLQNYLMNGGSLLLLLSPSNDLGITPLLQNWGVELDNRLLVDGSGAGNIMGFGPGVIIINNYGNHPITNSFRNGISIFPESRPLKIQSQPAIKATPLAITAEKTWAESDLKKEEISFDINYDLSGPLNIAIALEHQKLQSSRMVIFGSSTFITNGWFEQQLNGDLLLNSVRWLVGEDRAKLSLRPRAAANRRLNMSSLRARTISWLALRIVPLLAFALGVFNWYQRR